ncbi:MAG TPA: hypothetical protein DHV28_18730 [Ignavibacteriales bacterium]|nr:hypothetical protein [Ignavibacteriales bacterium]
MNKNNFLKVIILFAMILISCTASNNQSIRDKDKINIIDLEAWLNVMPGGPASFHITGKYQCNDFSNCNAGLTTIKISSDNDILYELNTSEINIDKQVDRESGQIAYQFFNNPGLKLIASINMIEKIDVRLIFKTDSILVEKELMNIPLTRAY